MLSQMDNTLNSTKPVIDSHQTHKDDAFYSVLIITAIILASLINVALSARRWNRYFPESGASMIFGVLMGGILKISGKSQHFSFQPEMFYFFLLPPIIFEAGFSMKQKNFFRNMSTILMYALLGTLISALVFGYGLYAFTKMGLVKSIDRSQALESLLFGALISATDPVATLSIMNNLNVNPLLFSLVFGESVLNDAVSIVLYNTLGKFVGADVFSSKELLAGLGDFLLVTCGSVGIGIGFGLFSAMNNPPFEIVILISFAYLSYVTSELAELTGIVSIFITAAIMQHYNWYSLSEQAQTTAHHLIKLLAMISETVIFIYLGITFSLSFSNASHDWDPKLLIVSLPLLFFCRACNIFPLSALANLRRKQKIPIRCQIMQWFAGMRGAIAFALSINLQTDHANVIQTTTLFIVLFTTIVQGLLTSPLLRFFNLVEIPRLDLDESELELLHDKDDHMMQNDIMEVGLRKSKKKPSGAHRPLFGGRKRAEMPTMITYEDSSNNPEGAIQMEPMDEEETR
ncbi:sodium/hydrogen exchanger, Na+/H+ exchanger, antiporter [Planoprotostelium fungivorum]|uniref:Sodium/hydrogen exchanger n=1 Tax=Planoprotostelium fungivorum TaxID=1890364 RepID=A0A2P6NIZ8_9EUKA|nr:sodium/hydrogen exchanger, Na+/H+ exchanger, antiporter [Planoprotostelium fungivorum]